MRALATAMGLLLLATRLSGQTLPLPVLPPEPAPEPEPTPSPNAPPQASPTVGETIETAAARARPWEYVLGATIGWDGNIDFVVPDGPSGVAVVPRAGLTRVFSSRRGQLRATAAAGGIGYPNQEGPRRYYGELGLDGGYRSSPNTSWHFNGSGGLGYSDSSRILLEQGVSLPIVKTRSFDGAVGLSTKAGTRTSLRIDGRYYRTEFDSPGLINGASLRGTLGLERELDNRNTAAISYSLEDVLSGRKRSYLTHFGSVRWTRVLSPRSGLLLEAGGSYTPDAALAVLEQKESFFGGASFTRQVKRSSLTLFVRREVTPAFGIGVSRLELRSGLRAGIPIGRAWDLRMTATHAQPETPQAAGRVYSSSDEAFAALGRRVGRYFQLTGEARYRRRGATSSLATVEAFSAGLFLTLISPAGGTIAMTPAR